MKKTAMTLMILTGLTACDSRTAADFKGERSERLYQTAMDEFAAGRIDPAVAAFEKAVKANPANASARFQLACLLQDAKHDHLGAICGFRDYLLLAPESDKASMARDRMAICERLLADDLAKKLDLAGNAEIAAESGRVRKDYEKAEAECERLGGELAAAKESVAKLERENDRMRKLVSSLEGGDAAEPSAPVGVVTEKDLLDDDDAAALADPFIEAKALADAAADEDAATAGGASILPRQPADAKEKKQAKADEKKAAEEAKAAETAARPETYVVQDGDTLYKIANRFYGRTSAWKEIREANKEKISTDGRVRSGQTIKLP